VPESGVEEGKIPITYVPFRNAHLLAAPVSWAEVLGAERVIIGAVAPDSSGYPDCRPEYYDAFNALLRVGTKEGRVRVEAPLLHMTKAAIVRLGLELGAPFPLSWSCYQNSALACGRCESCRLRRGAFRVAGASDPIAYAAGEDT
jgi:7-cyano-7-deazaguanine synthase